MYDDAESGMWRRSGTRTNAGEVRRLLEARTLILAEIGDELVGSINVTVLDGGVGEFGMLVADLNCHTMRLEVVFPRHWKHPSNVDVGGGTSPR